ncbi:MAG: SH3 domain-containing protein [Candidatus Viridilinea halotolerans]|uniref:SH3 domain-containing protein n=1 Tax=Candidatus Viridilinea halotolerans TaxID=2491704 RepID=A0A426U0Y9_9CHLR|nr:MAG: SH3 domain-containing protein [Candidatus Viridilinea halotolerans]
MLPLVIALIVVGILILVGVFFAVRRMRSGQAGGGDGSVPNLGGAVDYTSLPLEDEPRDWRERFARLSLAGRILVVLVPLLIILGLVALIFALRPLPEPEPVLPTPVPVTLVVRDATVFLADPLTVNLVVATTGLADGDQVTVELREDGEPFVWFDPEAASGLVRSNEARFEAARGADAAQPDEDRNYTVVVADENGNTSDEFPLVVLEISGVANNFYNRAAAVPPTPTATATPVPSPTPEPEEEATPTPEPTPEPDPALPTGVPVTVINGGNVRAMPFLADNVVGGINAGEQVQLVERTPNALWYYVRTVRDEVGWVSTSLINVPPGTQVSVANVVSVFVPGAVVAEPTPGASQVDSVNLNEVVQLLRRSAASDWYEVRTVRDLEGWVPATLLGIPPDVANAVPVAP